MVSETRRAWLEANKDKIQTYQKEYRKNNKDRIRKLIQDWHKANPNKRKDYKHKYKENKRSYGYDLG